MNCPNCQTIYNTVENIPLILIGCGHTLCQKCINLLFDHQQQNIICSECYVSSSIDSPSLFPKNMALLNMTINQKRLQNIGGKNDVSSPLQQKNSNSQQEEVNPGISTQKNAQINVHSVNGSAKIQPGCNLLDMITSNSSSAILCKMHHKKLQAFCVKDKTLLCIDCILSQLHKTHKIESINNALEIQKEILSSNYYSAIEKQQELKSMIQDVERHLTILNQNAQQKRTQITQIFNDIRRVMHERQSQLKQNVAQLLVKEEDLMKKKVKSMGEHLRTITKLKSQVENQVEEETCIQFLGNCRMRQKLGKIANQRIQDVRFKNPYPQIKKETEIQTLFKALSPKPLPSQSQSNSASNHKKLGANNNNVKSFKGLRGVSKQKKDAFKSNLATKPNTRQASSQNSPPNPKKFAQKYPTYYHIPKTATATTNNNNKKQLKSSQTTLSNTNLLLNNSSTIDRLNLKRLKSQMQDNQQQNNNNQRSNEFDSYGGVQSTKNSGLVGSIQNQLGRMMQTQELSYYQFSSLTDRKKQNPQKEINKKKRNSQFHLKKRNDNNLCQTSSSGANIQPATTIVPFKSEILLYNQANNHHLNGDHNANNNINQQSNEQKIISKKKQQQE